jgi:hypothetical protein
MMLLLRRLSSNEVSILITFLSLDSLASLQATSRTEQALVLSTPVQQQHHGQSPKREITIHSIEHSNRLQSSRLVQRYMTALVASNRHSTWCLTCENWKWVSTCGSLTRLSAGLSPCNKDLLLWSDTRPIAPRMLQNLRLHFTHDVLGWCASRHILAGVTACAPNCNILSVGDMKDALPSLDWIRALPPQLTQLHIDTYISGLRFTTQRRVWPDTHIAQLAERLPELVYFHGGQCELDVAERYLRMKDQRILPSSVVLTKPNDRLRMCCFASLTQLDHCRITGSADASFLHYMPQLTALSFSFDHACVPITNLADDLATACKQVQFLRLSRAPLDVAQLTRALAGMPLLNGLCVKQPSSAIHTLAFVPVQVVMLVLIAFDASVLNDTEVSRLATLAKRPDAQLKGIFARKDFAQRVHIASEEIVEVLPPHIAWPAVRCVR